MTELSTYLKNQRKEHNLTQEDLSDKSGVGLRLIREIEQGKTTMRMDKVNQIIGLFGSELVIGPRRLVNNE
ncbi:helix-turn-helix transcriptional regulator [Chitinophagaceae bacterium LWZ2-11]